MLAKFARDLAYRVYQRYKPALAAAGHRAEGARAASAFSRCVALTDSGRLDDARVCYEKLLEMDPANALACNNLGIIHQGQGAPAKAAALFHEAIRLDPSRPQPYVNLGNVLQDDRDLAGALLQYDAAIRLEPALESARYGRATALLALGRFEEGWKELEWRAHFSGGALSRGDLKRWDGSQDIAGKRILLRAEQGFGDALQFVRYASLVAARGGDVSVECPRPLQSLVRTVPGVRTVIAAGEPTPDFDYEIALMSLPLAFATSADSIPASVPYVEAEVGAVADWHARLGAHCDGLKVGIAWSGNPTPAAAPHARSLPVEYLADLARLRGCTFFSLQKGEAAKEAAMLRNRGVNLHDFTSDLHDFSDTAAHISALDAVVSVDTAVAHLAGALAKPVFVALPFSADWRWRASGAATPWYPTMHLFRQPAPGDWRHVVEELKRALEARVA
jgi:tetratricopeptide (TPR) repeat protein